MATKKVNKNTILKQVDKLKNQTKGISDEAIIATDNLVDFSLTAGKQWQGVFAKALKSGTILFGNQQEMILDTLETAKDHYNHGAGRLKQLLELKTPIMPLKTPLLSKIKAQRTAATKAVKQVTTRKKKAANSKSDTKANDLRIIEGIGPKIESLLNKAGIRTFQQLATADLKTIKAVLETAGPRYQSRNPSTWRQQAKLAANGKWEQLKAKQKQLKGGVKAKK